METTRVKYPRTYHFFNSPNLQNDDRKLETYDGFYHNPTTKTECPNCKGGRILMFGGCNECYGSRYISSGPTNPREVIATIKMDGENTTMYSDHIHARSLDSAHHESRTLVKQIHGQLKHLIPNDLRVCGENMQACHSIYYTGLPAYFIIFNIWQGDRCLSYEETMMWIDEFRAQGVPCSHTPIFYQGLFDIDIITKIFKQNFEKHEGFVVRDIESFSLVDFSSHVGKYVRKGHVQTSEHWLNERMLLNRLRESTDETILCYTRDGRPLCKTHNES